MIRTAALSMLLVTASCASPTGLDAIPPPSIMTPAQCRVIEGKADHRCTPGALNPMVTQGTIHDTICVPNWTDTVRPPTSYTNQLKRQQMIQYGQTGSPADFEEDHEIALSVGGAPRDPLNLWPEPRTGPHSAAEKDKQEHAIHAAICADRITLKQGQDQMLMNWSH